MSEYIQESNFNSVYMSLLLLVVCYSNYNYVEMMLSNIYVLNYMSLLIIINIIFLYIMLTKITVKVE